MHRKRRFSRGENTPPKQRNGPDLNSILCVCQQNQATEFNQASNPFICALTESGPVPPDEVRRSTAAL